MSEPPSPTASSSPANPSPESSTGPAGALPHASEGLELIKGAVRGQSGYHLASSPARRKLNQNESPYDFPAELKREVMDGVAQLQWQRYPEFTPPALLEGLAAHYGWVADGVLVGNGSNELIQATLAVSVGPGDTVLAPEPTFALYRLLANVMGARYTPVPLGPGFTYDVDRIIEVARRERARVIVLNSPNNPTGSALSPGGLEQLVEKTGALLLCDEAYQDFGGPTAIPLLRSSSRIVVLRTFSKAFGLAGLRFGLALAHPAMAREIAKGKLPYNVNVVTLAAAQVALRHTEMLLARTREVIETRDRFIQRIRELPGLSVYPSMANFVLIRTQTVPAKELFRRLYDEYGILIRDVSHSAELSECLRISIGTEEDMQAVSEALGEILAP